MDWKTLRPLLFVAAATIAAGALVGFGYLLDAAQRWKPRELFWIVKHGIKMTGMPSWRDRMSDRQIWDVVGFLEASRQMPPQTYVDWRSRRHCNVAAPGAFPRD